MRKVDSLGDVTARARQDYIELRFEDVMDIYEEGIEELGGLEEEAVEFKERALLWVYIIEWFVVTGTLLLTSFLLWSLMIRRSLYREIGRTKMIDLA